MIHLNSLGQPVGEPVSDWTPPPAPPRAAMIGRTCRVEPLDADRHTDDLYAANARDTEGRMWTYLPYGPFATRDAYTAWVREVAPSDRGRDPAVDDRGRDPGVNDAPFFHAVIDVTTGRAVGVASYLRIDPPAGSIEVGHIAYSPLLQQTVAATEAMYLMMRRAFELGYRRYEWKCDALNARSRAAAQRLGLSYEGVFRQARVYKGRNRDTAWFAAIDAEWPALDRVFQQWIAPGNFDPEGRQRISLASLTRPMLARTDSH